MELVFWGVRGSIPTPGMEFSRYGGNTSCVELRIDDTVIIFDMGSGIKKLGDSLVKRNIKNFDILVSHFHYDHTCGLPFFKPAYDPTFSFSIRSGKMESRKDVLGVLNSQICSPSFPITVNNFNANVEYKNFDIGKPFYLKDKNIKIDTINLNHPDGAIGYRVCVGKKSVCYITDHEHTLGKENQSLIDFLKDSNVLIYDSTYKDEDFKNYIGWGHSTWQEGCRLAKLANIKKYFIYHHNPDNTDDEMEKIEKGSRMIDNNFFVAKEGMCVNI
ncbi:MAG: MBL fold metallo-hydrolase [Rickettsiales bacterium]|nr:MBL fold metallo-hydrolase [Rickettsiales bacterium]|tara:strand:+ start:1238 stop:2056 length:819 start_codon:yes stop_codon:yes gene_type:complete